MTTATRPLETSRQLACTRVYKAPKDLLLRMWGNPEHISNWWGPRGFTTTTHAMEFKTDGTWKSTMHGPDGTDYASFVRYIYVSPDRIEYEQSGANGVNFSARVDFRPVAEGTEMSFVMTFPTVEMLEHVITKHGAKEGLISTMTRLDEYAAGKDPKAIELVIVRQFNAPQERVWQAMTETEQLNQWVCPLGMELVKNIGDFRVGGEWTTIMGHPSGMQFEVGGEYLAIEPIRFLKMTHRWKRDDGTYKPTTTITYTLHTHEDKTTLTFVQTGFWSEEARSAHLGGWSTCFHELAVLLEATKAARVVELVREFDAPIDLVWKCWTQPERVASWFAPKPYTCPKCEIDFQPGGAFLLVMRSPSGEEHAMSATIVDIEPLSRLGWVFSAQDANSENAIQGGTTVMFDDLGGRTRVTVGSYAAAFTDPGVFMIGGMEQGWNMTLDQMVEVAVVNANATVGV